MDAIEVAARKARKVRDKNLAMLTWCSAIPVRLSSELAAGASRSEHGSR